MSLFLRKECQSILDGVKLDNYHVQVNENSKMLQIVGECGKVLVSITGIRLSRMAPPRHEVALALELFDAFMAKHVGTFKEFNKAKALVDKQNIPTSVAGLKNSEVTKNVYGNKRWELTFNPNFLNKKQATIYSDGEITIPGKNLTFSKNTKKDLNYSLNKIEIDAIYKWIKSCEGYSKANQNKNDLLSKLNSCEI